MGKLMPLIMKQTRGQPRSMKQLLKTRMMPCDKTNIGLILYVYSTIAPKSFYSSPLIIVAIFVKLI
jgi:hypothetical protein